MQGFFSKKETESSSRPDGKPLSCTACGLYRDCHSPRMLPYGGFRKGIMCIGEAPGEQEDINGKPWQGKTGRLLQKTFQGLGISLFEDCISLNAVHCRPHEKSSNRAPTNYEIDCCRRKTLHYIQEYQPKVIFLFGNSAVYSLIGHRWKKDLGGITKWRGWRIPDQDFHSWLIPAFHPSYVERGDAKEIETVWLNDLKAGLEVLKKEFPTYKEPEIEIISDLRPLRKIKSGRVVVDFETTGLKPHAPGHRIVSCAVADTPDHAYSFLMPETRGERLPLIELLQNPEVGKIAQNMKYEDTWAEVRLRTTIENWWWDTMLATHILDNRPGVCGLKFQTYVQFGVVDYSSEVSPWLTSKGDSANEMNRILELIEKPGGATKLLTYGGMDTINTYRLAEKQNILPF